MAEAAKLCNYMHLREAERLHDKSLLQKANLDKAIDFMDPIDEDIPRGEAQRNRTKSQITFK